MANSQNQMPVPGGSHGRTEQNLWDGRARAESMLLGTWPIGSGVLICISNLSTIIRQIAAAESLCRECLSS
jgi:hypothetical protein